MYNTSVRCAQKRYLQVRWLWTLNYAESQKKQKKKDDAEWWRRKKERGNNESFILFLNWEIRRKERVEAKRFGGEGEGEGEMIEFTGLNTNKKANRQTNKQKREQRESKPMSISRSLPVVPGSTEDRKSTLDGPSYSLGKKGMLASFSQRGAYSLPFCFIAVSRVVANSIRTEQGGLGCLHRLNKQMYCCIE